MKAATRDNLRERLTDVLEALDAGDDLRVHGCLRSLAEAGEAEVLSEVSAIIRWMRAGVDALSIDQQLSRAAATDLPDLVGRLDAVIHSSEAAALRTLDLVEQGQAELQTLRAAAASNAPSVMADSCESLRRCLSAIAEAQSYQDLNGQTIKKAIHLLGGVEDALVAVLAHAGIGMEPANDEPAKDPLAGRGPRIAGLDPAAVSQSEADDLLSNLGL